MDSFNPTWISALWSVFSCVAVITTFLLPTAVRPVIVNCAARRNVATELQEKFTRWKWLTARWLCCAICMAVGILPPFKPEIYLYPSASSLCGWLWTWYFKAIIDVIEDVLPSGWTPNTRASFPYISTRSGLKALYILCAAVPCFLTPIHDPTICIAYATMLAGSLLAGGVDTITWQVLACICAAGVARGLPGVLSVATKEVRFYLCIS